MKHTSIRVFIIRPNVPSLLRTNCRHKLRILDWLNKPAKPTTTRNKELCNIPTYISKDFPKIVQ